MMTEVGGERRFSSPRTIARTKLIHVASPRSAPHAHRPLPNAEGAPIAAHCIEEVVVTYGGDRVARFRWILRISRDPLRELPLKATREAPLEITWKDNRGGSSHHSAEIRFS